MTIHQILEKLDKSSADLHNGEFEAIKGLLEGLEKPSVLEGLTATQHNRKTYWRGYRDCLAAIYDLLPRSDAS